MAVGSATGPSSVPKPMEVRNDTRDDKLVEDRMRQQKAAESRRLEEQRQVDADRRDREADKTRSSGNNLDVTA